MNFSILFAVSLKEAVKTFCISEMCKMKSIIITNNSVVEMNVLTISAVIVLVVIIIIIIFPKTLIMVSLI